MDIDPKEKLDQDYEMLCLLFQAEVLSRVYPRMDRMLESGACDWSDYKFAAKYVCQYYGFRLRKAFLNALEEGVVPGVQLDMTRQFRVAQQGYAERLVGHLRQQWAVRTLGSMMPAERITPPMIALSRDKGHVHMPAIMESAYEHASLA